MKTSSHFYLVFLFLIIILTNNSYSQNNYNIDQFFNEGVDLIKNPVKWQTKDFLYLTLIAGGTFGLTQIDEPVRTEMLNDRSYLNNIFIESGRIWGEAYVSVLLSAYFLIQGSNSNNLANKRLGFELGQSLFYTLGTTATLKYAFGRARPRTGLDAFQYHPFSFKENDYMSLPSGHTSTAFTLSTVLSLNAKNDALKVIYFIPAFLTAFSRVYQNHHWTSDVFLGGFLGYFVGKFFHDLHSRKDMENLIEEPIKIINFSIQF